MSFKKTVFNVLAIIGFLMVFAKPAFSERFTIEQCLERAREYNLNLKRSESDLKISTLRETKAKYNFYPFINSSAKFNNKSYNTGKVTEIHEYYFELVQPLYHFGEFKYKLDEQKARKIASLLDLMDTNVLVERDVIIAYLNILRLKKLKIHTNNTITKAKGQYEIVEDMVTRGIKEPKSRERWKVLIDTYQDDQVRLENALADTYTDLRRLLQYENLDDEIHIVPLEITEEYEYDKNQMERLNNEIGIKGIEKILYQYAMTFSPAIKRREFDIKASQSAVAYERANNMPKIDLTPRWQREEDTNFTFWQLGLRGTYNFLNLPGWEDIVIKKEELNRTVIDFEIFIRDRVSQIRSTFFNYLASIKKEAIAERQAQGANEYLEQMHMKFNNGIISDIELIDAFNSYYTSNNTRINVLYDFFTQREQIYSLIGYSYALQTPTVDEFTKTKDINKLYSEKDLLYDYFYMNDMKLAIMSSDMKKIEELRDKYRKMIGRDAFRHWRILHFASYFGNKKVVEERIRDVKNVNVNALALDGITPLHLATLQGHSDIVQILLKHGANPNLKADLDQWTPILVAAKRGFTDICEMLIKAGANVNNVSTLGRSPLHNAVEEGFLPIVKMLVEAGADLNAKTALGRTPLDLAKIESQKEVVKYLESVMKNK